MLCLCWKHTWCVEALSCPKDPKGGIPGAGNVDKGSALILQSCRVELMNEFQHVSVCPLHLFPHRLGLVWCATVTSMKIHLQSRPREHWNKWDKTGSIERKNEGLKDCYVATLHLQQDWIGILSYEMHRFIYLMCIQQTCPLTWSNLRFTIYFKRCLLWLQTSFGLDASELGHIFERLPVAHHCIVLRCSDQGLMGRMA